MAQPLIYKIKKGNTNLALSRLVDLFGVPESGRQMAIYLSHDDNPNREVHVKMRNNTLVVKEIDLLRSRNTAPIKFNLGSGMKALLKFLKEVGFSKGTIGESFTLSFRSKRGLAAEIFIGTFIDDIVYFYPDTFTKRSSVNKLYGEDDLFTILDSDRLAGMVKELNLKKHEVIDELGIVHPDIYQFCISTGFDIGNGVTNLNDAIESFSNDFSKFENLFYRLFNQELLSKGEFQNSDLYKPISIVIPSYNSEGTILKTLASIQSQNLPLSALKKTEVIIVDDGSQIPVQSILSDYDGDFFTPIRVIRLETNGGLSTSRNIGAAVAKHKVILFLDSDVLLSKNYLLEISVRNIFMPNAVFVAFKENINKECPLANFSEIAKGLPRPDISRDMRVTKYVGEDTSGLRKIDGEKYVEILSETNCFKKFGYGRKVGIFDLPSMVIGHNISLRKQTFSKAGGFSKKFKGWGMEDSYFGARLILNKKFVIPVLSCGVFHIDHQPRSGSEEKRKAEFEYNLRKYIELLASPIITDQRLLEKKY